MTGRINLTPAAERQLNDMDDWIAENATAEIAGGFVLAILEHIEGISWPRLPAAYATTYGRA